jgi:hypothetical protein
MKYQLTGKVSIRNQDSNDPMEITKDHTETVEASSKEEAIELSLSGFTEEEEPCWEQGYPEIKILER